MTAKSTLISLFLVAIFLNIASAQVSLDCASLQDAYTTVKALETSSFQISNITLTSYYVPSYIYSACGAIGVYSNN